MTNNHHTVIATGAAANASVFNSPLSQLDTSITTNATNIAATTAEVIAARAAYPNLGARLDDLILAGGNVATKANGVSNAGQKVLTVDSTTGFIVGAYVTYLLNGTTLEGNTIASIQTGVSLTLGTNIGTGGVLDDSYISMISISEYQAAQAIPHAGTLMLPDTMEYVNGGVFNVAAYGASPDASGTVNAAAFQEAIADASVLSDITQWGGSVVFIPPGTFEIEGGLDLEGATCSIIGSGLSSVIRIVNQVGPALDFSGYLSGDFQYGQRFENFAIEGDNSAGATKMGIRVAQGTAPVGQTALTFRNLFIRKTGGACIHLESEVDLCLFENITLYSPVTASANDVPYLSLKGIVNGNTFLNVICRNLAGAADGTNIVRFAGQSVSGTTYDPQSNKFYSLTTEKCQIPEGAALVYVTGGRNEFYGFADYDSRTTTDSTADTCFFRFVDGGNNFSGGNFVTGVIPGWLGDAVTNLDYILYGVILEGGGDMVVGTRGAYGNNVMLKTTAGRNYVNIGGVAGSVTANPTITDNATTRTNYTFDALTNKITTPWNTGLLLTVNDTTPTVAYVAGVGIPPVYATYFYTTNTSATLISNFTDAVMGQRIVVAVGDANTTFDFSSSYLIGHGGVDWICVSGDWLEAFWTGSVWLCATHDAT